MNSRSAHRTADSLDTSFPFHKRLAVRWSLELDQLFLTRPYASPNTHILFCIPFTSFVDAPPLHAEPPRAAH